MHLPTSTSVPFVGTEIFYRVVVYQTAVRHPANFPPCSSKICRATCCGGALDESHEASTFMLFVCLLRQDTVAFTGPVRTS